MKGSKPTSWIYAVCVLGTVSGVAYLDGYMAWACIVDSRWGYLITWAWFHCLLGTAIGAVNRS